MKKFKLKSLALSLLSVLCVLALIFGIKFSAGGDFALAEDTDLVDVIDSSSQYLDTNYLEVYSIPTDKFDYSTDGGKDENLKNAFDRNFNSYWESDYINGNLVGLPAGKTIYIEMDFDAPYTLDRILYGNEPGNGEGFPREFKLYGKIDSQWQEIGLYNPQYDPKVDPNKFIMVSFEPTVLSGIRFEYRKAHEGYRWSATCREMILLQPECDEIEQVRNLFSDYNEQTLNEDVKTQSDINKIRTAVSGYASESVLESKLKRAEQILSETIKFDPQREMSTDPDALNVITQRGDIAGYARNTLKMAWFGTNRQPTGIYVKPNEVLTVYVEANQTNKLPTICYSQFWGHWKSWLSASVQLRPGKNVIEIKSLIHDINEYTHYDAAAGGTILGGPVYISNPYEPSEQPGEVKVYFEGGTLFPIFRLGDDETRYKYELDEYANFVLENPTTAINVTELVSENFIMTVRATVANTVYKTHSPQQNLNTWDAYIKEVLEFDGVVFDPNKPHYDKRSQYLNCNVRMAQPTGEAYAHVEHVGIQSGWEQAVLYTESFGWGYTHEFGHMMDNPERTVSECSNNMMSKYNETAMEKDASRGEFESTLNSLSPDDYKEAFFDEHDRLNYLIWWLIESYDIGFWAKLENNYRYVAVAEGLTPTEKQVYLSSLAVGFDLSYYFERFGYSLSGKDNRAKDPIFKISTASEAFRNQMNAAKTAGRILEGKVPKLWYLDSKQYLKKLELGSGISCYLNSDTPSIVSVTKSGNGYNIIMHSDKSGLGAHLGYEIWENYGGEFKVVGFSHSDAWTDTRNLPENYKPTYKIVAYDRDLKASGFSQTVTPDDEQYVCRLGETNYSSLSAAVKAANGGDTIYLYKDCYDSDIVINKNIKIVLDESVQDDITISLAGKNNLFYVLFEKTLTLLGNSKCRIILDGGNFVHEGSLVRLAGYMNLEYVTLQNSNSKTDGGAIRIVYEGSYQTLNAKFVEITNCNGKRGGAIYDGSSYMTVNLESCKIYGNTADYGGAIFAENGTVVIINNSEIYENSATYGGAFAGNSYVEFNASKIHDNTATEYGGAICFSTTVEARQVYLKDGTILSNNNAKLGSTAFIKDGVLNVISAKIVDGELTALGGDENYSIYLVSSLLSVHAGKNAAYSPNSPAATFGITLFIDSESKMLVYGKAFEVEEGKLKIVLENLSTGKVYCEAINFNFDETDSAKLVTEGSVEVSTNESEHSVLRVALAQVEFNFVVNGKVAKVMMVDVGSRFVLPYECWIEDKYAISWSSGLGSFDSGEEITVEIAQTFTAVLGDRFKLELLSAETDEVHYLLPDEIFILPKPTYEMGQFVCWIDGEENRYLPYSQIKMTASLTLYASIASKLKVSFKLNGEELYSEYVAFDEYVEFPDIAIPEGKRIAYYLVNGERVEEGFLNATSNVEINAVLEDIPSDAPAEAPANNSKLIIILAVGIGVFVILAVVVAVVVAKKKKSIKK